MQPIFAKRKPRRSRLRQVGCARSRCVYGRADQTSLQLAAISRDEGDTSMKIEVLMTVDDDPDKDHFLVRQWATKRPERVISVMRKQLEAAKAVWPELKEWQIVLVQESGYPIEINRPPEIGV